MHTVALCFLKADPRATFEERRERENRFAYNDGPDPTSRIISLIFPSLSPEKIQEEIRAISHTFNIFF